MEIILPRRSISGLPICLVMLLGSLWMGTAETSVGAIDPREMLMLLDKMDSSYSMVSHYRDFGAYDIDGIFEAQ